MYKKFLFHTVLMYKKYIRLYKITKFNNSYMYILTKFEVKYNAMKIPETFRIKRSSCVHRAFTVHIALAFALRSSSAFAHRSGFTYRSPTCIQRSDIVHSAFAQRSFSVRSPFTHRSLIVRSPFKWESKTFQGM